MTSETILYNHHQNRELLDKPHFLGAFIFHRADLLELLTLIRIASKSQDNYDLHKIIHFVNPSLSNPSIPSPSSTPSDFIALPGIGNRLRYDTAWLTPLAGYDKAQAAQLYQVILSNQIASLRQLHRHRLTPKLPFSFEEKSSLFDYYDSVNNFFNYFESLFDPHDIVSFSQKRLRALRQELQNPSLLTPPQIRLKRLKIVGYEFALARNHHRTS